MHAIFLRRDDGLHCTVLYARPNDPSTAARGQKKIELDAGWRPSAPASATGAAVPLPPVPARAVYLSLLCRAQCGSMR